MHVRLPCQGLIVLVLAAAVAVPGAAAIPPLGVVGSASTPAAGAESLDPLVRVWAWLKACWSGAGSGPGTSYQPGSPAPHPNEGCGIDPNGPKTCGSGNG
jgi:hypothetical protein